MTRRSRSWRRWRWLLPLTLLSLAATCPPTPHPPDRRYAIDVHAEAPSGQALPLDQFRDDANPENVLDPWVPGGVSPLGQHSVFTRPGFQVCADSPGYTLACVIVSEARDQGRTITLQPIRPPVPTANLRGQYVIACAGCPYGPRPGAADNIFFMNALDQVWDRDPTTAETILQRYIQRGANHLTAGPAFANGYHDQYPPQRWLGRADRYAAYLEWVTHHGLAISLWVLPDVPPYYDPRARTFDWARVEADLTPFYTNARIQAVVARVVYMWEDYQASAEMVRGYDWLRRVFPHARRYWHNPPGHLSPGEGAENEQAIWRLAAAHGIHGLYLQAWPASAADHTARPPIDQLAYDLHDMVRRFRGEADSPWGRTPILAEDGRPLEVVWAEGTAFDIYNVGAPESLGATWGARARTVPGITDSLDGLP